MFRRFRWLLLLTLWTLSSVANGQSNSAPSSDVPLARMERSRPGEDVCVLVARNGSYRIEQQLRSETRVFLGGLSGTDFDNLQLLLNDQKLREISQAQVRHDLISDTFDAVTLDIFRADGSQHLAFMNSDTRKPFRTSIDPILKWMTTIQKAPHQRIGESNASRCRPGIESTPIPITAAFLVSFASMHSHGRLVERSCEIVYSDGKYRHEQSSQRYGSAVANRVFESSLSTEKLVELRQLLDSPSLQNLTHTAVSERPASDFEITTTSIPRDNRVQNLVFSTYFGVKGDRNVGGLSNMQYSVDRDAETIAPLHKWLKANVEQAASTPVDAAASNCRP